ncbi:CHAP domain-containing protein [Pseudonocardia sichuanensis]
MAGGAKLIIGSPATATGVRRPSARPRPAPRRVGPSFLTRLARLLRLGRIQLGNLTAEDLRVLACLAVASFIALGGQVDLDAPAAEPATSSAGPAAGGQVAATTRVLDLARAEIGTVEGRGGATPYHQAYGLPSREPWCAAFVWDVFRQAGGADSIGPKTAYTPTMAAWFRERGQWTATPTVGALVFYNFPDRLDRIQHVGIVESFDAKTITTIEGNTGPGATGSQDDGDGVYRRTRPRNGAIVGYGLPIYSLAHTT